MAFTYDLNTATGQIRLHINDTDDGEGGEAKLTDAEIAYAIGQTTSTGEAVIYCLEQLILPKLTDPNFEADWLKVDLKTAFQATQALITLKRRQFGISSVVSGFTHSYRADSRASEEPDFSGVQSGADADDGGIWVRID
jgi:hypothetical protein